MNALLLLAVTFVCLLRGVAPSPITFELTKGQRECFYALTPGVGCSVSYYFAVQEGESNDFLVDYEIFAPSDRFNPILERFKERLGEWSFYAEHKGEYAFCFYGGDTHNKIVDLDINYQCDQEDDARSQRRKYRKEQRRLRGSHNDQLQESLENSVDKIERQLYLLEQNMHYYENRNNRNHHTVRSTNSRIVLFSVYGILLVTGLGFAQVFVLNWLFRVSRKHAV